MPDEGDAVTGSVAEDAAARGAVRKGATGDDDVPADCSDRRVAHCRRQVRHDTYRVRRAKGDDRVEPSGARVAADDVRGIADARAGLVRAARRQIGHVTNRSAPWVDAEDLGVLVDAVAATEEIVR